MSKLNAMRCPQCGTGTIRPVARRGRKMRHKTMMLEVPAKIAIPTCDHCGEEWFDETTTEKVDAALEDLYRQQLCARARKAIDDMTEAHVSQRAVERALGISVGYLSKLRSGEKIPSPELVLNLAFIAKDPAKRVHEAEEFWSKETDAA